MKQRLKRGVIIYLVLLGLGVGVYFGVQIARQGYVAAVGGGGIDIWARDSAAQGEGQAGVKIPAPGEATTQNPTSGQDSARTALTPDTTARLFPESTMIAVQPTDTAGKTPSAQDIKSSGGKPDFPEIKPAVDLSAGGGLDVKIKLGEGVSGSSSGLGLGTGPQIKIGAGEQLGGGKSGDTKPATDISSGGSSSNSEVLKLEKQLESTYRNDHNLAKTLEIANQILKMDPTNPKAALYTKIVKAERKALAYEDVGESSKALAEWKKILSWDPGNRWAQKGVERNE